MSSRRADQHSDPSQTTPEKGKRIVEAATKPLIADYQEFLQAK